jgi:cytochrome c5
MKKFLSALIIITAIWSCAKKATPAKSETGTDNTNTTTITTPVTTTTETKTVATAEVIAAGKTVFDAKCGKCHPLPVTTDHTAAKWGPIMDAMAPKARLTDSEKANALAYVLANAKQ